MSALAPARAPRSKPAATTPPLRLVVTGPLRAGRLSFALLVGFVLAAGLIALLLLHMLAAQDAFQAQAMHQRLSSLDDRLQHLRLVEQQLAAPERLATRAEALGMRPTGSIAFVRTGHHGRTVGVVPAPSPAPVAAPVESTTASATAQPNRTDDGQPAHHRRAAPAARH